MPHVFSPNYDFEILKAPNEELAPLGVSTKDIMVEARHYIRCVANLKGFNGTITEEHKIRSKWMFHDDAFFETVTDNVDLPVFSPDELKEKVRIVAENNDARPEPEILRLRRTFAQPLLKLIDKIGNDPQDEKDKFVLDYMLQGAMLERYDPNRDLTAQIDDFVLLEQEIKERSIELENENPRFNIYKNKPDIY